MRNLICFALVAICVDQAPADRHFRYCKPVAAAAPVQVQVKTVVQQVDRVLSDSELAGEVARRVGQYQAGLRALGSVGYGSQYYAPSQVPYVQGTTAYALTSQSVDVFGRPDLDKIADLLDGSQRLASQQQLAASQIANGVNGQIGALSSAIAAQQQATSAAREIEARTRQIETMAAAMATMAAATAPQDRLHIQTTQQPAIAPEAPQDPPATFQAAGVSVLAQKCAKCHSGDTPKGDFALDQPLAAAQLPKLLRVIMDGKTSSGSVMPPAGAGITVTPEERAAMIGEACQLVQLGRFE